MSNVGRYFCVALPFILTAAAVIATLIVGLTGVSSNDLYLYKIDIGNLSIDASELQYLINNATNILDGKASDSIISSFENKTSDLGDDLSDTADKVGDDISDTADKVVGNSRRSPVPIEWHDPSLIDGSDDSVDTVDTDLKVTDNDNANVNNITAADLGLANYYQYNLWSFCSADSASGKKNCTKAEFNYASKYFNLNWVYNLTADISDEIQVPTALNDGLNVYKTVTKWNEVVFIVGIIALAAELLVGAFSACSRVVSCIAYLISGIATLAAIANAVLLTATGAIIVGIAQAGDKYGAKSSLGSSFLAVLWLGVAFAIAAGLFWLFSVCCCKPEHRASRRNRHSDSEKLLPTNGPYAPLGSPQHNAAGMGYGGPQRGGARSDLAYEPYSHSRV
ncbi:SUR7 protein [Xylariaceae sp. FL1272]|nr:SUR7 protein [Xylariaceae sp. FL1272]